MFANNGWQRTLYRAESLLGNSRTFKLVMNCLSSVTMKAEKRDNADKGSRPVNAEFEKLLSRANDEYEMCRSNAARDAIGLCGKAINMSPRDYRAYLLMGHIYLYRMDAKGKAVEYYNKALSLSNDSACFYSLFTAYYRMGDVNKARQALWKYLCIKPGDLGNYWGFILHPGPLSDDKEIFERMTGSNLTDVINIAKNNKARMVLLGYPEEEGLREMIAEKNKVEYVDNRAVFEELSRRPGYKREQYFAEDGHCNARGYGMMAANVYKSLTNN